MIAWIRSGDKRGTGEVIMMKAGKYKVAAPGFGGVLRGILREETKVSKITWISFANDKLLATDGTIRICKYAMTHKCLHVYPMSSGTAKP
jgi:hypothetical protein